MAQHDYVIANGTGAAVRSDLNNALAAIVSQNSGATAPATTYAFQFWADTTTGLLKLRNSANSAWITLFQLDGEWSTLPVENGTAAAPSIYFKDSGTDTGFYSPGTDQVAISTGGTGRLFINSSGSVGIGTSNVNAPLEVNKAASGLTEIVRLGGTASATNDGWKLSFYQSTVGEKGYIGSFYDGSAWQTVTNGDIQTIRTGGTERVRVDSSGRVGIGTASPVQPLEVITANGGGIALRPSTGNATQGLLFYDTASGPWGFVKYDHQLSALSFGTYNSERARIDASGRLLVGTSSARDRLFNSNGTESAVIEVEGTSQNIVFSGARNSADAGQPYIVLGKSRGTTVNSYTVVSSGDGLGTISFQGADGTELVNAAQISAEVDGTPGANDMPGRLVFSTTADGASSPTERMRIDNGGSVMVGMTSNNYLAADSGIILQSNGVARFGGDGTSARNIISFVNGTDGTPAEVGRIQTNGSATSYLTSSDYRLKENVISISDGIDRLKQLKPSRFNFLIEPAKTVDGFIAHEVQGIVPEAIDGEKDAVDEDGNPIYQGIDQSKLVPLLTAALQEAIAKIESLEARLTAAGI